MTRRAQKRYSHVRRSMQASRPKRPPETVADALLALAVAMCGPSRLAHEARASVALDPDCGTHSVDDDCPGGHRGTP